MTDLLEARLQSLEDDRALRRLVNAYAKIADELDWKRWSELFAEDGTFIIPGTTEPLAGRQAIYQGINQAFGGAFERTLHYVMNLDLAVDGDSAQGMGDLFFAAVVESKNPAAPSLLGGRYKWTFSRTGAEWWIAHAENQAVWNGPPDTRSRAGK